MDWEHEGTVSHGTLRSEDLYSAFINKLKEIDRQRAEDWLLAFIAVPSDVDEAVEELEEQLNEVAAEGYYFGTLEGDASDFGFWKLDDPDEVSVD